MLDSECIRDSELHNPLDLGDFLCHALLFTFGCLARKSYSSFKECGACALIFLLSFLLLIGVFSVHVDAEFEAILHSKIEVKCIVDADPIPRLTWSRLDATNAVTKIVLKQEPGDPKLGTLERSVTIEDDGKWRCTANSFFGGKESDFIITVIGTIIMKYGYISDSLDACIWEMHRQ